MTETSAPEYLTAQQIADELGVHVQTVQSYFRDGAIPGRKIGKSWRTTRSAFDSWLTGGPCPRPLVDDPATAIRTSSSGIHLEVKDDELTAGRAPIVNP